MLILLDQKVTIFVVKVIFKDKTQQKIIILKRQNKKFIYLSFKKKKEFKPNTNMIEQF